MTLQLTTSSSGLTLGEVPETQDLLGVDTDTANQRKALTTDRVSIRNIETTPRERIMTGTRSGSGGRSTPPIPAYSETQRIVSTYNITNTPISSGSWVMAPARGSGPYGTSRSGSDPGTPVRNVPGRPEHFRMDSDDGSVAHTPQGSGAVSSATFVNNQGLGAVSVSDHTMSNGESYGISMRNNRIYLWASIIVY